jgi:hypothetical protein
MKRGKEDFAPVKQAHGRSEDDLVKVTIRVPEDDDKVILEEAERLGVPGVDVYRDAVAAFVRKLRKK